MGPIVKKITNVSFPVDPRLVATQRIALALQCPARVCLYCYGLTHLERMPRVQWPFHDRSITIVDP